MYCIAVNLIVHDKIKQSVNQKDLCIAAIAMYRERIRHIMKKNIQTNCAVQHDSSLSRAWLHAGHGVERADVPVTSHGRLCLCINSSLYVHVDIIVRFTAFYVHRRLMSCEIINKPNVRKVGGPAGPTD